MAAQFRRAVLNNERAAASEMVRRYGEVWQAIKAELATLESDIKAARKMGQQVDVSWLLRERRLESLRLQVEDQMRRFGAYAEQSITAQKTAATELAQDHAEQMVRAAMGPMPDNAPTVVRAAVGWNRLSTGAVQEMVAAMQEAHSLRELLDELGTEASEAAQKTLIEGIALGRGPRETARELRKQMGLGLQRALRISRTETMRSYREATRASYQENSDLVEGWVWRASLDGRTCPMCWAMHGTRHRLNEKLDDHPNGRCISVPITPTWAELGKRLGVDFGDIPEREVRFPSGIDAFARASEDVQRSVLGGPAYRAFADGRVTLADFVARRNSKRWGTTRYAKSLKAILGADEAAEFYAVNQE